MQDGERTTRVRAKSAVLRQARIRLLNDALRRTGQGGRIVMMASIAGLGNPTIAAIVHAV